MRLYLGCALSVVLGLLPRSAGAQSESGAAQIRDLVPEWIAGQLSAEAAVRGPSPSPSPVHPSAVILDRVDSVGGLAPTRYYHVLGSGHGTVFAVLVIGDHPYRMAGFGSPQVLEAWEALRGWTRLSCAEVETVVFRALDPNGAQELVGIESGVPRPTPALLERFMKVAPATWPRDTTVRFEDGKSLVIRTLLSRESAGYPGPTWVALAYSTMVGSDCRLLGWDMRIGPSVGLPSGQ